MFAEGIANDVTRGYVGGTATGLTIGQDFGNALDTGFASGVFTAPGPYFNSLVGHGISALASLGKYDFRNGAFFYPANTSGNITLGDAVVGPRSRLDKPASLGGAEAPYTVRTHEIGHVSQSSALGFHYYPAHIAALMVSGAISFVATPPSGASPYHYYNPLERSLHPHPSY